jgi:hypothetical protein
LQILTFTPTDCLPETAEFHFVALTPLRNWHGYTGHLAPNLDVSGAFSTATLDFDTWRYFLSGHDVQELDSARFWLRHGFSNTIPIAHPQDAEAVEFMQHALIAIQILAPVGAQNDIFIAHESDSRLLLDSGYHPAPLREPMWSRLAGVPRTFESEFPSVLIGVRDVFNRKLVRLQNPVYFLEHGLQATNLHLRILLWVTGLDAITMASSRKEFCHRVNNLLGQDSYVFPPERHTQAQPKYVVADVVEDLYHIRSEIAHGREISLKFRQQTGIPMTKPHFVSSAFAHHQYRETLADCSAYLLCAALRKIFVNGLIDEAANEAAWRRQLRSPVSRC